MRFSFAFFLNKLNLYLKVNLRTESKYERYIVNLFVFIIYFEAVVFPYIQVNFALIGLACILIKNISIFV